VTADREPTCKPATASRGRTRCVPKSTRVSTRANISRKRAREAEYAPGEDNELEEIEEAEDEDIEEEAA